MTLTFFHIPKTGGTSLNKFFRKKNIRIIDHDIRNPNYKYLKHIQKEENEFRFCVVRNPWDRLVSIFFYLSNGGNCREDFLDAKYYNLLKYEGDFKAFIKNEFRNNSNIFNQIHFKEQYKWICDDEGNILVDKIIRFENFKTDMKRTLKENNISIFRVPHKNKSTHNSYQKYYDQETKEIVEKAYQTDIYLFKYSFE